MLVVKASYNGETRRFTIPQTALPTFDQLHNQLHRVFSSHAYYLSNLSFTPVNRDAQLIASEVHSAEEYNAYVSLFDTQPWTCGTLRFDVFDEPLHKRNYALIPSNSPPIQVKLPSPGINSDSASIAPLFQGSECSSIRAQQGKKEVQALLGKFLDDFGSIMSSTFGDEPNDLDVSHALGNDAATPTMPGSFSRPISPPVVPYTESSQEAPHPGVWCDYCGRQVLGMRHKCNQCAEYDLCSDCVLKQGAKEIHISNCEDAHSFSVIHPPSRSIPNHPPQSTKAVHVGVYCDVCQNQIVGERHKCLDCVNYDLCETCHLQTSTVHPLHEFMKFSEPGRVVVHTIGGPVRKPVHNASCDLCDSTIRGDRYKCTNCPDFDVCERCFVIAPEQHPTHIFVKIAEPRDIMVGRIAEHKVEHPATCNACMKMIIGIRYKCIHPSCPDFDLCMNCEALPINVHPETHPLVKIRSNKVTSASLAHLARSATSKTVLSIIPPAESVDARIEVNDQKVAKAAVTSMDRESSIGTTMMMERVGTVTASLPDFTVQPVYHATFLSDNNMEDGIVIAPGAEFVKSWKVTNSGNQPWPSATELVFVGGDRLAAFDTAPNSYEVGGVDPGAVVDVWAADMKAPDEPGRYISHWCLRNSMGLFGDKMWCDIVVPELDKDGSAHSGSVILPTPLRAQTLEHGGTEVGADDAGIPPEREVTTTATTNDLSAAPSLTDGSTPSEIWEDSASVGEAYENAPATQGLAQSLEYVVLYDSDSSDE